MKAFFQKQSPISRFFMLFFLILVLFYAFYYSPLYTRYIMPSLLNLQANVASVLLGLIGHPVKVTGDLIQGEQFQVSIKGGCDGIEATALYIAAVCAMPLIAWSEKWKGLGWGILILTILNLIRIVGLYLAGIYWVSMFEVLHLHGGVIIFMMISIVMWLIWVNRVMQKQNRS
ncbi:MAG TPA: archaeosortase/exosortase family protein [Saprospiraceae bacterium]|nr:archaeosortase/exosortase family protein [Saprospiraceae bacterium]